MAVGTRTEEEVPMEVVTRTAAEQAVVGMAVRAAVVMMAEGRAAETAVSQSS
jgi:hypothetical protein